MSSDWDSVTIIRKKAPTSKDQKSSTAINAARRTGAAVVTEKKMNAGRNTAHAAGLNAAKLEAEDEEFSHKTISADVGKIMQKARMDKGFTQKDLATKINEKPQIVQEYESGRAIPNQQVLGKLERALGVKLRGKDIGKPLVRGKKKE